MTGYIEQLRALVGDQPLILPGTSVILVDGRDRLLLIQRTDTGGWGLPGGFMEPGESFEDTGRREVREEVGVDVGELFLLGVFSGPEYFYRYPNGDRVFNVTAAYVTRCPDGVSLSLQASEAGAAKFFDVGRMPADIITPERPIVARYADLLRDAAGNPADDGWMGQLAGVR